MSFIWLQFCVFCIFLIFVPTVNTGANPKETWNSYINVLNRIVPCQNPEAPFVKDPKVIMDLRIKENTSIIIGNITFTGKTSNVRATLQDLYYIDGKWTTTFIASDLSCRSKLISIMMEFIGMRFNKKTCTIAKGSFLFEVDYNKLDHLWMPLRAYGKMIRRLEARSNAGTILCRDFESDIKPVN